MKIYWKLFCHVSFKLFILHRLHPSKKILSEFPNSLSKLKIPRNYTSNNIKIQNKEEIYIKEHNRKRKLAKDSDDVREAQYKRESLSRLSLLIHQTILTSVGKKPKLQQHTHQERTKYFHF
jgi:hypothetical protein